MRANNARIFFIAVDSEERFSGENSLIFFIVHYATMQYDVNTMQFNKTSMISMFKKIYESKLSRKNIH